MRTLHEQPVRHGRSAPHRLSTLASGRHVTRAAGAALCAALAGCDTLYGVTRTAPLAAIPEGDCVAGILASLPGIGNVKRASGWPHEHLTMKGWVTPPGVTEHFFYWSTDRWAFANLYMGPGRFDVPTFEQSMESLGGPPQQRSVDTVRPLMAIIERRVGAECGRPELPAAIVETCSKGLACGPLEAASAAR